MLNSKDDTKSWMKKAAMILLKSNSYEDISIRDIASKAGVARSVFYYHYSSKEEIFEEIMLEQFEVRCTKLIESEDNIEGAIRKFISFVYKEKDMVIKLHSDKTTDLMSKLLMRIIAVFSDRYDTKTTVREADNIDAYLQYMFGISNSIVSTLIKRNFIDTEVELYDILTAIINT